VCLCAEWTKVALGTIPRAQHVIVNPSKLSAKPSRALVKVAFRIPVYPGRKEVFSSRSLERPLRTVRQARSGNRLGVCVSSVVYQRQAAKGQRNGSEEPRAARTRRSRNSPT
jgi:hypothetical protein